MKIMQVKSFIKTLITITAITLSAGVSVRAEQISKFDTLLLTIELEKGDRFVEFRSNSTDHEPSKRVQVLVCETKNPNQCSGRKNGIVSLPLIEDAQESLKSPEKLNIITKSLLVYLTAPVEGLVGGSSVGITSSYLTGYFSVIADAALTANSLSLAAIKNQIQKKGGWRIATTQAVGTASGGPLGLGVGIVSGILFFVDGLDRSAHIAADLFNENENLQTSNHLELVKALLKSPPQNPERITYNAEDVDVFSKELALIGGSLKLLPLITNNISQ